MEISNGWNCFLDSVTENRNIGHKLYFPRNRARMPEKESRSSLGGSILGKFEKGHTPENCLETQRYSNREALWGELPCLRKGRKFHLK